MAELKQGVKPSQLQRLPVSSSGFCTLTELKRYLNTQFYILHRHMAALGIVLEPFVRREKYMTKVYKKKTRLLTEDEARRIIERHRGMQGREIEEG